MSYLFIFFHFNSVTMSLASLSMRFQNLASDIKIFHGLTPEQLAVIEPHLVEDNYQLGDWVVDAGETASAMYMVRSGEAEIWMESEGQKQGLCLAELSAGDAFGEMSLLDCQCRVASVLAISELKLFCLPYRAMAELYEHYPKVYGLLLLNIGRELSRRLREADKTLMAFALPLVQF